MKILRQIEASLGSTVRSIALVAQDGRLKPRDVNPMPTARMVVMLKHSRHPFLEAVRDPAKPHRPAQDLNLQLGFT